MSKTNQFIIKAVLSVVLFLFSGILYADNLSPTPRVMVGQCYGTAVVFMEKDDKYWAFTAGHMMANGGLEQSKSLDFFNGGRFVVRVPINYETHEYQPNFSKDLCILSFQKSLLKNHTLIPVPLASKGTKINIGSPIFSVGYPHGNGPFAMTGTVVGNKLLGDSMVKIFKPRPFPGQSGSGMFVKNEKGEVKLIGILSFTNRDSYSNGQHKYINSDGSSHGIGGFIPLYQMHNLLTKSNINVEN